MIISEYQARREELERQLAEISERQTAHKLQLSAQHQLQMQKISSRIGQLKHQRGELNKKYQMDKDFFRRKYKAERRTVEEKMHMLRLEYLTANGVKGGSQGAAFTPPTGHNDTDAAQADAPDTIQ